MMDLVQRLDIGAEKASWTGSVHNEHPEPCSSLLVHPLADAQCLRLDPLLAQQQTLQNPCSWGVLASPSKRESITTGKIYVCTVGVPVTKP